MPAPVVKPIAVSSSTMKAPGVGVSGSKFAKVASGEGLQAYALSLATVIQVDHVLHTATLRTETGETLESTATLTYPGGGARQFLGAVPSVGDVCLVGWGSAESGRTRQPYVLSWFVSPTAGHDWWITQPFGQDEYDLTPKDRETFEGLANRTRYKLRHMLPGNVVGSSAQGSDVVLDEGVMLSNRRGNELLLRDQDQSLVVRTLQQFHVGAGFRVYSGIVQRDARMIPTSVVSDGRDWSSSLLINPDGTVITEEELEASSVLRGSLQPSSVFLKDASGKRIASFEDDEGNPTYPFTPDVDPYMILQRGLIVDRSGHFVGRECDSVYGGKAIYRVSKDGSNANINPQSDALTEYRIEVALTSDGTLPVSEQTDGFDVDRLPGTVPGGTSDLAASSASPYVEFVMGTVVGNDPFTNVGKTTYGLPMVPSLDGDPSLIPGVGSDQGRNIAFLVRVRNPDSPSTNPSFTTITKDGRSVSHFGGPKGTASAELSLSGGAVVKSGGRVSLTTSEMSLALTGNGEETMFVNAPGGTVAVQSAGVSIKSSKEISLSASRDLTLSGSTVGVANSSTFDVKVSGTASIQAGDRISQTSKTRDTTSYGKSVETFSGPKDGLATFGPVREVSIATSPATGFVGGTADQYELNYGDRKETIRLGDHETTVQVGDATYAVIQGKWKAASGANTVEIDGTGIVVSAVVGSVKMEAVAGSTSVSGSASVSLTSAGPIKITGTSVTLSAPGTSVGGIICGSDLDPVSGAPLATLGMGSPTHLLSNA